MDLLYGSEQKYSDMDEEINDFLDNDVFQSPPSMVCMALCEHMVGEISKLFL